LLRFTVQKVEGRREKGEGRREKVGERREEGGDFSHSSFLF
jgi:hypothetical protein